MNTTFRLAGVLALSVGLASAILAGVNAVTAPVVAGQGNAARDEAVAAVVTARAEPGDPPKYHAQPFEDPRVLAIYLGDDSLPAYYAAEGRGVGYNTSSPLRLVAVYTNPDREAAPLLAGYNLDFTPPANAKGFRLLGFAVTACEETPGLGDQAAALRPTNTWAGRIAGHPDNASPDRTTAFQRQFRGRAVDEMTLAKDGGALDAITGATITTRAVVAALADAQHNIQAQLHPDSGAPSAK